MKLLDRYNDFIITDPSKAFSATVLVTLGAFIPSLILSANGSVWTLALWPVWMGGTCCSVVIFREMWRNK